MREAMLILSDSGGIQEAAPALGTPLLVLRDTTERPEAITSGNAILAGTDPDAIMAHALRVIDDPYTRAMMSRPAFPFGNGKAASQILGTLQNYFALQNVT
jgi:UDP-N-acetylglucosamine 2-epimerase (non-hydrolysing)